MISIIFKNKQYCLGILGREGMFLEMGQRLVLVACAR